MPHYCVRDSLLKTGICPRLPVFPVSLPLLRRAVPCSSPDFYFSPHFPPRIYLSFINARFTSIIAAPFCYFQDFHRLLPICQTFFLLLGRFIMRLYKCLPLSLMLLTADLISPAETRLVPGTLQRVHKFASKHTRSLAKDIRLAFGGVLVPRDSASIPPAQHVVYCKTKQAPFNAGPTNGNHTTTVVSGVSGSMSASKTSTTSGRASPTSTVPDSPWKLQQSYVSILIHTHLYALWRQ